jgi:hypothetical protein
LTVVRRCMRSKNLADEEALAHWGLLRQKKEKRDMGCETDQSLPSTVQLKNGWSYNFTPLCALSECTVQYFYLITRFEEMQPTKRTVYRFISLITFMSLCIERRV